MQDRSDGQKMDRKMGSRKWTENGQKMLQTPWFIVFLANRQGQKWTENGQKVERQDGQKMNRKWPRDGQKMDRT